MKYNRYESYTIGGKARIVPFIAIPKSANDTYAEYFNTRLDILSYQYYGDANYGWLILQANPECGSLEFNIPQHTWLRIPLPLENAISYYKKGIKEYNELYGVK